MPLNPFLLTSGINNQQTTSEFFHCQRKKLETLSSIQYMYFILNVDNKSNCKNKIGNCQTIGPKWQYNFGDFYYF